MGELQTEPYQLTFNGSLKVTSQGSAVTSRSWSLGKCKY